MLYAVLQLNYSISHWISLVHMNKSVMFKTDIISAYEQISDIFFLLHYWEFVKGASSDKMGVVLVNEE